VIPYAAKPCIDVPLPLAAAYQRMLAHPTEPYLLDVIVEAEGNVYPMIPADGSYRDIIINAEDLAKADRETQGSTV
jgi:acetolactate synthase-1/2/3 large subunit